MSKSQSVSTPSVLIELKDIRKFYVSGKNKSEVLKGINLQIKQGEFVAIMGPSGSGKSTLMNIIGTLDRPSSGQYLFAGKRIDQFKEKELAKLRNKEIGFVFQSFNLLSRLTVAKNIERPMMYGHVPMAERQPRILEVLKLVDLENKYNEPPLNLSGGQQQRIALARALVMKPKLILADEPTGALDSKTARKVMEGLKEINQQQGTTIVLVTHDSATAKYAQKIIRVKDGHVGTN